MSRLGAILLAAGGSTRMKRPKLLLPWGDDLQLTVIGAALTAIVQAPVEWIGLVTGALGDSVARRARTAYRLFPTPTDEEKPFLRVIHNPAWQAGMRSSIALGLKNLPPHLDGIFIALGDMPDVPPAIYHQMAAAFSNQPGRIYRPVYRRRVGHPVLIPRALLGQVSPKGDEGLKELLQEHKERVQLMESEDSGVVLDLDTPEAYRAALYLRRARKPSSHQQAASSELEPEDE